MLQSRIIDLLQFVVVISSISFLPFVQSMKTTLCHGLRVSLNCTWPAHLQISHVQILEADEQCSVNGILPVFKGTTPHGNCSSQLASKAAFSRCHGQQSCLLTTETLAQEGCRLQRDQMIEVQASCKREDIHYVMQNYTTSHYTITTVFDAGKLNRRVCPEVLADGMQWIDAVAESLLEMPCPNGFEGIASWKCLSTGQWDPNGPDLSECVNWTIAMRQYIQKANGTQLIHQASRNLTSFTMKAENMSGSDIMEISKFLTQITDMMKNSSNNKVEDVLELNKETVKTVSSILTSDLKATWKSLKRKQAHQMAEEIMSTVEEGAFLLRTQNVSTFEFFEKNVALSVKVISAGESNELVFPSCNFKWNNSVTIRDSVELSADEVESSVRDGTSKIVFAWYNNLGEFVAGDRDESNKINSRIISASLNAAGQQRNLTKPAIITLQHLRLTDAEHVCVYWNQNLNSSKRWLSDGCSVLSNNDTHTVCSCNHLTSFAVLINHGGFKSVNHEEILTYLTWIGLSLSLFCLTLCIFTFIYFKSLQSIRTSIHANLCICLFVSQLTFLVGIDMINHPTACSIIAGVLHYFLLATFTWMALEGVQLYVMLIEVFEKHTRIIWYYVAGYGFPAVFVSLSAGLNPAGYGTESACWLTTDSNGTTGVTPFIWSFIAPASFVAVGNLCFVVLTASMMYRHGRRYIFYSRIEAIKGALKGTVALLFLLGTTWIFGLLWWWEGMLALQYLFCIFNAFQGVYIFIFHCLLHSKVRCEYRKILRRCRGPEYSPALNTSTMKVKYSSNKRSSRSRYKRSSSKRDGSVRPSFHDDNRKTSPSSVRNLRDASEYFSTQDRASMKILFTRRESQATPYLPTDRITSLNGAHLRTFSTRSCPGSDSPNRKRPCSADRDESPFKRCMSERKYYRGKYNTPVSEGVSRILKSAASNHSIVPCRYLPAKAWENGTPDSTCTRTTTLSKDTTTLQRYHVPISPPAVPNSPTKEFKLVDKRVAKLKKINSTPSLGLGRSSSWNSAEKKRREIQRRLEDQPSTSVPDLMTQLSQKIESRDISLVLLNYLDEDGTLNQEKLHEARQLGNL